MRSRTLREADNIAHAFQELASATRQYSAIPRDSRDEGDAWAMRESFNHFVSQVRGEIAQQTKLSEAE